MSRVRVYARRSDGSSYRVMIWHRWLREILQEAGL